MLIGFIGAGNMARAIAGGLSTDSQFQNKYLPSSFIISDKSTAQISAWTTNFPNIQIASTNTNLVTNADLILLAVKPQQITDVLTEIGSVVGPKLVVSIAAGITIERLRAFLPNARIARVMPNTPSLLGAGMSALCYSANIQSQDKDLVRDIFSAVGETLELDESLINAVTGLSGSGPAFIYQVAQAFMAGGIACGLSESDSRKLIAQTLVGAGQMLLARAETPAELVQMVASPGGTTEAGLKVLATTEWQNSLKQAVIAAKLRADELEEGN